jgi:hypothetical protein
MFRKKDDEQRAYEPSAPRDETAYEDNWYRSLKALSERQDHEPTEHEDEVPVEASAEAPVEASPDGETPVEASETDDQALPEELEVRAGQLLERLRSLHDLGDEAESALEPETRSV